MNDKAILQLISEIAEDYFEANEDKESKDIYISIGKKESKELIKDPLYEFFCTKYSEQALETFGVLCEFTGIDVILEDVESEMKIEEK